MQNLQKNLDGIATHNPKFIKTFNRIPYNSITIEHFEMVDRFGWNLGGIAIHNPNFIKTFKKIPYMLTDFDLVDNEWLHSMYGIREMWVPTYLRDIFFGGMSTTSRSESINAFLK